MKVICKFRDAQQLSEDHFKMGFSKKSCFDVSVNSEYLVYGISLYKKIILYLICDDYKLPNWYPAEIFTVINNNIPYTWKFNLNENADDYSVKALFGYPELVESQQHYIGLIERDKTELEIFANYLKS